jgi:hypothetical protein
MVTQAERRVRTHSRRKIFEEPEELIGQARKILRRNDMGGWTRAAPSLYPHQWRWDSAFIPPTSPRSSVEQASTLGWRKYVGLGGRTIGMRTFGSSAPLKDLQERFGFTPQSAAKEAMELFGSVERGN